MDTRRDFIKKSMLLSGAAGTSIMPASIRRALAIDPAEGSTYMDAEHIVILMQENRSFDHCFGTLRGVRGYDDPRAITLPNKNLVWLQTNRAGETYAPFRFDIRDTKATWMGSVPHSRSSQVDADNGGKYDKWLDAKRSGNKKYADMPLTMGYYTREDIPFNYALADAFTVCDQNFSSAMTSTWPNRLFFWTGTVREQQNSMARAHMRNDLDYGEAKWRTFPERLQENDISWKIYQNDVRCGGGLTGEQRSWLTNFGCNQMEFFSQYNVKFSSRYVQSLQKLAESLPAEINGLEQTLRKLPATDKQYEKKQKELAKKREVLKNTEEELVRWSRENYDKLSPELKALYEKAFTINANDPDYHELTTLNYEENGEERTLPIPKGDILYQFRKDVSNGELPTVSWLVPSQNVSDHPSAPWYGAWYTSEILDILTKNPEVWKKTIFILTYDENDGYFDHIPPFVAPDPDDPRTGKCSPGITDTSIEFIRRQQELNEGLSKKEAREGPVGLGFRVPMIIASPWSRGGKVCSQVFDHTSTLQFLETFLNKKFNKKITETNITKWRRTLCGNLTSAFSIFKQEKIELPFLKKDPFLEKIYNAKFKKEPSDYRKLSAQEIAQINHNPAASSLLTHQEPGVRPSCPLPYQLYADGKLSNDRKSFELIMEARNEVFGKQSAGAPFNVYAPGKYYTLTDENKQEKTAESVRVWHYAVLAGDRLTDNWPVDAFENGLYHLRVYGPNGFFREYKGSADDPAISVVCEYESQKGLTKKLTGNIALTLTNLHPTRSYNVTIHDNAYKNKPIERVLAASGKGKEQTVILDLGKSYGWYDFSMRINGFDAFEKRYAGRVETGKDSYSDPVIGRASL